MSRKPKLNRKLLALVVALLIFGIFIAFHNPATDELTYPPPKRMEQK
jgi:hypothetical protein